MNSILFVCEANRFRSIIAAEYFRALLLAKNLSGWSVSSAGTWTSGGLEPHPQATSFLRKKGLLKDNVYSREISKQIISDADLIIVMTEGQKEALILEFPQFKDRIFQLSEICLGQIFDIPDPILSQSDSFEDIATEICRMLDVGFERIIQWNN